jgi:tetratricopeptide (TPR) repeat protein
VLDPKLCAVPTSAAPQETKTQPDRKAKRQVASELEAAHSAYEKGDFTTAITSLQAAYAIAPSVEILYNIAQTCREAGLPREALSLYEEVLKRNTTEDERAAIEAKLAELRPKVAETENARAVRALDDKRYDEALVGFQRAFALNPEPAYLFRLGEAQRLSGRNADAIASYERLLKEAPNSLNAGEARRQLAALSGQRYDEEATAHYDRGEYVESILSWDAAYKAEPRPIFLFRKAEAMRQTGQRLEAALAYER